MAPWVIAVLTFLGGGGGLAGIYSLIKHKRNVALARDIVFLHGVDGLDPACRIVHPWADATKDVRARRQRKKATAPPRQQVVQMPRQLGSDPAEDDSARSRRTGRTAG